MTDDSLTYCAQHGPTRALYEQDAGFHPPEDW